MWSSLSNGNYPGIIVGQTGIDGYDTEKSRVRGILDTPLPDTDVTDRVQDGYCPGVFPNN